MNNKFDKEKSLYCFWLNFFSEIWKAISSKRRIQVIALIFLNVFSAFADILSLASLIPFLSFLLSPDKFSKYFPAIFQELPSSTQFILICSSYFFVTVIAGLVRMANLWLNNKVSFTLGSDIGRKIYIQTLSQDYEYLSKVSTSEFVDMLIKKGDALVSGGIIPTVQLLSSGLVVIFTVSLLLYVSPMVTVSLIIFMTFIYVMILKINRKAMRINSSALSQKSSQLIQIIQEAILCKVEITLYQKQKYFTNKYYEIDYFLRGLESQNQFYMHSPKIAIETIGIIIIGFIAIYYNSIDSDASSYIPLLATFALAAQKLLPNLQQIYAAVVNISTRSATLENVIASLQLIPQDLNRSLDINNLDFFWKYIKFENIGYQYENNSYPTFSQANFTINRGDRIGIIGVSGGGKTTLAKIIMGLKNPTFGNIYLDNKISNGLNFLDWYSQLAYVPQIIPILNTSIIENIAFGYTASEIDLARAISAAKDSGLSIDIEKFIDGYKSTVGEFGSKLSGGQKLKLGLARALYRGAKLLVLDEYTSALDKDTEKEIVDVIGKLSKNITIIVISHRPEAMLFCQKFIKVDQGKITNIDEI